MPGVGRAATLAAAPAERSWRRVSSLVIVGSRPCSVAPVASGGRGAFHPAHGVVCSKDSFVDSALPEQFHSDGPQQKTVTVRVRGGGRTDSRAHNCTSRAGATLRCASFCAPSRSKTIARGSNGRGSKSLVLGRKIKTIVNHRTWCERRPPQLLTWRANHARSYST